MNAVWTAIMLISLVFLLFTNPDGAVSSMIAGANNAVSLSLSLLASYSLWLGLFTLIEKTGISAFLTKILRPIVAFLFPSANDEAKSFISMNMSANFLGLGNAATPLGINAVCAMREGDFATPDMITFLVISSTSLQLLPSTVIGMRAARGSVSPLSFLPFCLAATIISSLVGIFLCKLFASKKRSKDAKICKKSIKTEALRL